MAQRSLIPLTALAACLVATATAQARDLAVVVTSKPIHSLTSAVMEGAGNAKLLVEGSASPHTFALKPSGAAAVYAADVFIRVSGKVEPFSEKIVAALPATVELVTLADTPELTLLDTRTGETFDAHKHDHDADDHHAHDKHDGKANKGGKAKAAKSASAGNTDGHVWLDPGNAKLMAGQIAAVLSKKDPERAGLYAANSAKLAARIDGMASEIADQMTPLVGRPFIVFHDAYQYFEKRFGLSAIGSITVSPDVQPSAKRLSALRRKIGALDATCVFAEPMYQPQLVAAVTEGTKARAGTLDPDGSSLEPGPDLYFTLMRSLARNLVGCLKPKV